ncbi:MAG: FAD/NAD(P)-binding oxidoreductase [Deltaproteobacteria bacterium]|jgi:NADPH-dependent 2,4-dienoyl-CoA reductase/sulfur reductase-like enzyme
MHVVILGNGVAGITTALAIRKRKPDAKITVVSGESKYHYSRPALMYIFMGHMRYQETKPFEDRFWSDMKIDLVRGWATNIDVENRRLEMKGQAAIPWDKLVIATGSKPNKFGWEGQDLDGVQGLYGLYDLKKLYENAEHTKHAVVVGGGLIGIELAEMLHSRHIPVTFFVREKSYWDNVLNAEESQMVSRLIRHHGFGLELSTNLERIEDDGQGRAAAAVTSDGKRVECQLVGLTAGVSPNVDVVKNAGIDTGRGVLVNDRLETHTPDVYAVGDCAEIERDGDTRNLLQQVWYTGKMQGEVAAENICGGQRDYDPGIWFNSAKFLDLEYHTYGDVNRRIEGEHNLYWEHESGRHSARLVHKDDVVIGLQTMGLRWRHVVAEKWLKEKRSVKDAIGALSELTFEPEFHNGHEQAITTAFSEQLS